MAGVIGSDGLTDATSNAGVCASSDPADNMMATLKDGNRLLDTAVYLAIGALSDIDDGECNHLLTSRALRRRHVPDGSDHEAHGIKSGKRAYLSFRVLTPWGKGMGHCTQSESGFSLTQLTITTVNPQITLKLWSFPMALSVHVLFRCDYLIPGLGLAVARLRWP
jgi:hypothetical protein